MGACFQAPHATPRKRQMEMSSWIDLDGLFVAPYKSRWGATIIITIIIMGFDSKKSVLGLRIIWVQVSRLPMPHPDRGRWKCTTITNYSFIFQYASSHKIT